MNSIHLKITIVINRGFYRNSNYYSLPRSQNRTYHVLLRSKAFNYHHRAVNWDACTMGQIPASQTFNLPSTTKNVTSVQNIFTKHTFRL